MSVGDATARPDAEAHTSFAPTDTTRQGETPPERTGRRRRRYFIGLLLAAATVAVALLVPAVASANTPTWTTDQQDYAPSQIVHFSGLGYAPNTTYSVPVMRPDGSIVIIDPVTHQPLGNPMWQTSTSDAAGNLEYDYQLDGVLGLYTGRVYPQSWEGKWNEAPVAETSFTDAATQLLEWKTSSGGEWITGTLNSGNSNYKEGEVVPFQISFATNAPQSGLRQLRKWQRSVRLHEAAALRYEQERR
jgi:hypothetical protein